MKRYNFTPDAYIKSLYGRVYTSPYAGVCTAEQAYSTGENIRTSLAGILAVDKIPCQTAVLKPEIIMSTKRNGITRQLLRVEICKDLYMCAFLLIPDIQAPEKPGVVALCGHSYGARQIVRARKSGQDKLLPFADNYQKDFALTLAQNGAVVIAPELIGFGEARLAKDIHLPFYASSCKTISSHLLLYGISTASVRIYQTLRCVDLLSSQPSVSADNIGVMGISGGGLCALYSAVLDERIKKTVVSGYVNTFETSILNRWHCPDNYIPGILTIGEMYDFACAIAPRKLLLECGEKDKLFPVEGSRKAIENISRIYTLLGKQDCFSADIFPGKHEVSGKLSRGFLIGRNDKFETL